MDRKERITNLYLLLLLPIGLGAIGYSAYNFPYKKIDVALIVLSVVTVFFSSYLRMQLPRTKIHLTISDALIFLALLLYGGEVAVLLAVLEAGYTSLNLRHRGVSIKGKTVVINMLIAAFSVLVTSAAIHLAFGPANSPAVSVNTANFVWLLAVMALSQFTVNSVCVAAFVAIRSEKSLWQVWNEYCLNALVLYLSGAMMAGLTAKAVEKIDLFLIVAVIGFFGLVYITYRRYVDDLKATDAKAENSERERAEQAEKHVKDLQHYVAKLEKSGKALHESHEKFRHAAFHDALTGLPNRSHFIDTIRFLLERDKGTFSTGFAVLFLDLNRFKTMNDSLGHSMGDCLIMDVGRRLSEMLGEGDIVGRFSGDEFAILLTTIKDVQGVTDFAEKVAGSIAEPFVLSGRDVFTSVSIGIAFGNSSYGQAEDILRDADIAMYYAKDNQKNYVIFDRKMHTRAVDLLQLETDLRYAIERQELEVYYQPIISLDDLRLAGFEALVRWNHPVRGLVSPGDFISVSEDTGLIIPMTLEILRKACNQIVQWQLQSPDNESLMVSVNLSGKHFAHPDLVGQVAQIVAETHIFPACLKLEITESSVMENAENAIRMLKQIKATGVQLSIDDFGTGYSSLTYLHRFPLDTLKIDRSFVSSMEDGTENGEIVRTIVALAKSLNLNVVAEGIESIHQLHQLRVLGCEYGQGYLFSRPLPVHEIDKLLENTTRWRNILPSEYFGVIEQNREYSQLRLS